MITIKSDAYVIYCRSEAEAAAAWKATQYQRNRAGRGIKGRTRERVAGNYLCTLPDTHSVIMRMLDPEWINNDWPRLERALRGLIPIETHVIRPGEFRFKRPRARQLSTDELEAALGEIDEDEASRASARAEGLRAERNAIHRENARALARMRRLR